MWVERIYDMAYAVTDEKNHEEEMIEKIHLLLKGVDVEKMTREKLEKLLCESALIGQRQGFADGFRFLARLILEVVI